MKNLNKWLEGRGGVARLTHVKITNGSYMPLVIEKIGTGPRNLPLVSVAHYYQQNGDAMRDPDMTFEVMVDQGKTFWLPITFRQDGGIPLNQEAVFKNDAGQTMMRPKLVKSLTSFMNQWDRNLKAQGFFGAGAKVESRS